ncbi:MAG: effector binding domain-containing protein [Spirochaetaceae bacterium]|nr:effector binding domain-containing protein [Spirochaetaceae bacterium]
MKNVYREIPKLLERYRKLCGSNLNKNIKRPWQYISLSRNFEGNLSWDYHTGHVVTRYEGEPEGLVHFEIPKGDYAVFEVRRKRAMFFSFFMAKLKKEIYTKWLPSSGYVFSGFEFEYNDETMKKKNPYDVDLYVGIGKKQA